MHVFINKSALGGSQNTIPILATYEDNVVISPKAHGDDAIMVSVPSSAVTVDASRGADQFVLAKGWRDSFKPQIANDEARDRILDVFPEESQRYSIYELETYMLQYGTDIAKWPAAARTRKNEIDRCWNYVNAVRARSTAFANGTLPHDPTADSNWPSRIAPYKPQ
jgi:hypothetical protein